MNAEDVNKLPRYIEAPGGGMWGPMPDGFTIANKDRIFVKLVDVEALVFNEEIVMQDGEEFVSVGLGGPNLMDAGWSLYAYCATGKLTECAGSSPLVKYYIKKEINA